MIFDIIVEYKKERLVEDLKSPLVFIVADRVINTGTITGQFIARAHIPIVVRESSIKFGRMYQKMQKPNSLWQCTLSYATVSIRATWQVSELHNLLSTLHAISGCILLVTAADFEIIQRVSKETEVAIEAYRYNGTLTTS